MMADSFTTDLEELNGGDCGRVYLGKDLVVDSLFPFRPGQGLRVEIVETTGGKHVLGIVPDTLEIDKEATDLVLRRSTNEIQADLEPGAGGGNS